MRFRTATLFAALLAVGILQGTAVASNILFDDGTITDPATHLVWLKDANCFGGEATFNTAWTKAKSLASDSCGLKDGSVAGAWRLPTSNELQARATNLTKFKNVQTNGNYWSTTYDDKCDALVVSMKNGQAYNCRNEGYIWPVRAIK